MKPEKTTSSVKNTKLIKNILVPLLIISIFFIFSFLSIDRKSDTTDEKFHLVRGLMLIETGDLRLNQHHPYLFNLIGAIPTQFDDDLVVPDLESENWILSKKDSIAFDLVEINGGRFEFSQNVLFGPRVMMITVTSVLLLITYFYVKKLFGFVPAVVTLGFLALDPNFIAHARIVTTDATSTLTLFLAMLVSYDYLKNREEWDKRKYLTPVLLATVFTIALLSKYTAVFAIGAILILFFVLSFIKNTDCAFFRRIFKSAEQPLILGVLIIILMAAAYKFQFTQLSNMVYGYEDKLLANLDGFAKIKRTYEPLGQFLEYIYLNIPLPFPQYINGFYENVFKHNLFGHRSYLLGEFSNGGWWYYFPIAYLVKEPIMAVLWLLIAFLTKVYELIKKKLIIKKEAFALIIPPILIFGLSMQSSINLGIRHLLPIFPFVFLLIGSVIEKSKLLKTANYIILSIVFAIVLLIPNFRVFPDYISYFNISVGNMSDGYKVIRDSNFDWNQNDLIAQDYLDANSELDITNDVSQYREHEYLVLPKESLDGNPDNRSVELFEINELLENGNAEIIDELAKTHVVIKF